MDSLEYPANNPSDYPLTVLLYNIYGGQTHDQENIFIFQRYFGNLSCKQKNKIIRRYLVTGFITGIRVLEKIISFLFSKNILKFASFDLVRNSPKNHNGDYNICKKCSYHHLYSQGL